MKNKYRLEITASLSHDSQTPNSYTMAPFVTETVSFDGLTFFQVCVILGGLQVLVNEEKERGGPVRPVTSA